jgi:hypothetical protein
MGSKRIFFAAIVSKGFRSELYYLTTLRFRLAAESNPSSRFRINMQTKPDARLFKAYARDYELFGDAALDPAKKQTDN